MQQTPLQIYTMRQASALILTMGFVILIVSLGSIFLVNTAAKYDESISLKLANYAEQATQTGFAHARKEILQDYINNSYTSLASNYRKAFAPLDTAGNPMDMLSEWAKPTQNHDTDPRINASSGDRVTYHIAESYQGTYKGTEFWGEAYGFDRSGSRSSRYYDFIFVDNNGNVTDEAIADYAVRYTVEIADENAKLSLNPDYPGHPNAFDYSDPDNDAYLAYQGYIQRYAKGLRSMSGAVAQEYARQTFPSDNDEKDRQYAWNYDQIFESIDASGKSGYSYSDSNSSEIVKYDRLFRGTGIIPTGNEWAQAIPGKVFSYGQMRANWQSTESGDVIGRKFTPNANGLRDQEWANLADRGFPAQISTNPNPNCPWHVNAVTMTHYSLQSMIFGLSSHLRGARTGPNWAKAGDTMTLDLFGPNYPEPFPIAMDAGKAVPLIGGDRNEDNQLINGSNRMPYYPLMDSAAFLFTPPDAYANSYWWDVAGAMYKAVIVGKGIWNYQIDVSDASANKERRAYDPNCKISTTPGDLSADPHKMLAELEEEFLRILGENISITVAGNSFTYNLSPGLLATPNTLTLATVGYGPQEMPSGAAHPEPNGKFGYKLTTAAGPVDDVTAQHGCFAQRKAMLRSGENTRAMEYLLNDVRMSLFGSPALNFNHDDANMDTNVAPNQDSMDAESTVNGWWDYDSAGNRVRKWSWWYEGIPLAHSAANNWLTFPGWYRFDYTSKGRAHRWDGSTWILLSDAERDQFFAANKAFLNNRFLNDPLEKPIKPFSATGRLFIGQSQVFNIVCRGELFDINLNQRITQFLSEQILHIDPNKDNNLSDTAVIYQRTYGRNKVSASSTTN